MMTKEELKNLLYEHENEIEWERYDFVDPPYCWNVSGEIEIKGYKFYVDGCETVNCGYEITSIEVEGPNGEHYFID